MLCLSWTWLPATLLSYCDINARRERCDPLRYAEMLARAYDAVLAPVLAWTAPEGDRMQPSGPLRQEWREMARQRMRDALLAVWGEVPASPLVQPQVEEGRTGWVLVSIARSLVTFW